MNNRSTVVMRRLSDHITANWCPWRKLHGVDACFDPDRDRRGLMEQVTKVMNFAGVYRFFRGKYVPDGEEPHE